MTRTRYTYLRNPISGVCVLTTNAVTIRTLIGYGWTYISRLEYKTWQIANVKADREMRAYSDVVRH